MRFSSIFKSGSSYIVVPGATFDLRMGTTERQSYIAPRPKQPGIRVSNELLMSTGDVLVRYSDVDGKLRTELTVLNASVAWNGESYVLVKPVDPTPDASPRQERSHCVWVPSPQAYSSGGQSPEFRGQVMPYEGMAILLPGSRFDVAIVDRTRFATGPNLDDRLKVHFNGIDLSIKGVPVATPSAVRFY